MQVVIFESAGASATKANCGLQSDHYQDHYHSGSLFTLGGRLTNSEILVKIPKIRFGKPRIRSPNVRIRLLAFA